MAAGPMKMRASLGAGFTEVRVLMTHPMETGLRKDADGKLVPMHFIQNLTVKVNGKTFVDAQISQAISRNPVFSFRFQGGAKGVLTTGPGEEHRLAARELDRRRQQVDALAGRLHGHAGGHPPEQNVVDRQLHRLRVEAQ